MDYLEYISKQDNYKELITRLFDEFLRIFNESANDERVIIPLLKTLERVFERDEVLTQKDILHDKLLHIYEFINKEIAGTRSVQKVLSNPSMYLYTL